MQVGDKVHKAPDCFTRYEDKYIPYTLMGVIIYVHPTLRWYTAEFDIWGQKLRESFWAD